jgi:hypothetical protein
MLVKEKDYFIDSLTKEKVSEEKIIDEMAVLEVEIGILSSKLAELQGKKELIESIKMEVKK